MSTIKAWNAHPTMETATLMANKAATMMLAMRPPKDVHSKSRS